MADSPNQDNNSKPTRSGRPTGKSGGPRPGGKPGGKPGDGKNGPGNQPPGPPFRRGLSGLAILTGAAILIFLILSSGGKDFTEVKWSEFRTQLEEGNVSTATVDGNVIRGEFEKPYATAKGDKIGKFTADGPANAGGDFNLLQYVSSPDYGVTVDVENTSSWLLYLLPLLPWLLLFGFIYLIFFRQLRSGGAGGMLGNFGRSKHRILQKDNTNVTFDDVAGVEEAKDEVSEIVEFLRNPKKFQRLGGRIPRGCLLVGPPGTGKTLLAKAIAGEAEAPFFSISGSDFVEMFVGVGASRVRDLFKQAKENSPCIIFLDEIDAVGRRRGSGFSSGGHDEREQTLNAILVEMDGFETNDQVIVIASTNRVDVLDPALTRPGRFDRQVQVPLPDVKGRMEILKVHARKIKLGPDADLSRLARATPGFSGADLAACINEAALIATLAEKDFVEHEDLEEARDKVRFGRAKKSRVIDEKEKKATAYHEAGHAVVQWLEEDADPLHKVTIIPRGPYGGATMSLPEKDRNAMSRKWCVAFMKVCFGGRLAEEMFTGDVNSGAYGDIRQATSVARQMITEWGMNEKLGFVYYGDADQGGSMFDMGGSKDYSEDTQRQIDEEVKSLIDRLYDETRQLLEDNRDKVEAVARALIKHETLDAGDVRRIMDGEKVDRPTVSDLLEQEKDKTPGRKTIIAPGEDGADPDVNLGGVVPT
ncbi:MAG: ATP-dependent zinc metalloprotease FtsH [Planctomycetota bacterium]